MQVEKNDNNGSRVSCKVKKGKPNQTFCFEVKTKTMPPQSHPPKPSDYVPPPHPKLIIFRDKIFIIHIIIQTQLLML